MTTRDFNFYLITNDAEEADERQAIRFAYDQDTTSLNSSDIINCVQAFNEENEDYRIEFVPYSSDKSGKSAAEKLTNDILSGSAPDLIMFGSSLSAETYERINALADLYPLMDSKDSRYSREDFLSCVLEPFENSKGELPYLTTDYYLETMVGKASTLDSRTSWSFGDMIKLNDSLEAGQTIMSINSTQNSSEQLLKRLLPYLLDMYIDYENETCDFSGEFKNLLEFCKNAKLESANGYDHPSQYQSEDIILKSASYMLENFFIDRHINFRDGDITYIGYPEAEGTVIKPTIRFGITKQSKVAAGAWEFIEDYLDSQVTKWDAYSNDETYPNTKAYYFPATNAALDAMLELVQDYEFYFKLNVKDVAGTTKEQISYGLISVRVANTENTKQITNVEALKLKYDMSYTITEEDITALRSLLDGIKTSYSADEDAIAIILEEASTYFSGVKSIDDVISLIQNRVSRLVSE